MSSNIDAMQRLIDYTQTIKPYHTKVYEVLTNCTYEEDVSSTIDDSFSSIADPCICEDTGICEGVGWGNQPFGSYIAVDSGLIDERGNPIYHATPNVDNSMWDAPQVCPIPDPNTCCNDVGWPLQPNIGWDTQPYSLYHWVPDVSSNGQQKSDVRGRPMYKIAPGGLEVGDAQYDYPYTPNV